MDIQQYQTEAARTSKRREQPECLHVAALGLLSEAGEIAGELKKAIEQERDIDKDKLIEEIGDCMWYLADLCTQMDTRLNFAAAKNIVKLRKRYPKGFTPAASIERRDKANHA
jgi:NTP pyrophosphatase (non-canonical NTP hydrolase)